MENINELLIPILEVPKETKYWVVRADGGKYYNDFLQNEFVAIGDNEITLERLNEKKKQDGFHDLESIEILKVIYEEYYPEIKPQAKTLYSKRLFNFMFEMSENDIVIVPSKSSNFFLVGIIESEMYDGVSLVDDSEDSSIIPCPFLKRRKVTWIKEIGRASLPEKMYWVLSAHQTLFNVSSFSTEINSLLSFIVKVDNRVSCSCYVSTNNSITLDNWHAITSQLLEVSENESDKIDMKVDVQSPGNIDFSGTTQNIGKLIKMASQIIDPSSITPGTMVAYSIILCAIIFGEANLLGFKFMGIHPYFFGKGKLERDLLQEEVRKTKLENELLEIQIKQNVKENRIVPSDPGKIIPMKKKKDNLSIDQDKHE